MDTHSNQSQSVRVERACKPCRDLKVRCVPPRRGEVVCQKCQRSGACCIFEERNHRKKRKVNEKRVTVETLEARLVDLAKQLEEHSSQQQSMPKSQIHALTSIHTPSPEDLDSCARLQSSNFPYSIPLAPSSDPSQGGGFIEQLFRDGILTTSTADSYLSNYRQMCVYFPFVIIPEQATVSSLVQTQSFLLHAILAVASSKNKVLQNMLDRSLRQRLLEAVLIDGIKSVEILQAFLIHLAWEHFFYVPKKRHSNQMLQLAISMCVDMGLGQSPKEASGRKIGLSLDHHCSVGGSEDDLFFSKSARRAYIGFYYLSTVSNWVWRKPKSFHCTEYVMECAQSLSQKPEYDSDKHILKIIQIQTLADKHHDVLLSSDFDDSESSKSDQFQTHLQRFQANMSDILSSEQSDCLLIRLSGHFATSYAHEMDHLTPCLWKKSTPNDAPDWSYTPATQVDIFMVCLTHAKAFVESFLSIPLTEYPKLSAVQWWGLICNIIFLYTLSIGIPQSSHWNVNDARKISTLGIYLDLLCYRMQSITQSTGESSNSQDLFSLMGNILANVKATYERLKDSPPALHSIDLELVHGTTIFEGRSKLQPNQIPHTGPKIDCPAFPVRSNMPDVWSPSIFAENFAQAYSNLYIPFQTPSMSSLDDFQQDILGLGNAPNFNIDPEMNSWDSGMI